MTEREARSQNETRNTSRPTLADLIDALDGNGLVVTDLEEVALTLGTLGSGYDLNDAIQIGV